MTPRAANSPGRGRSASGPRLDLKAAPTLRLEKSLLRSGHALVAGMDEVGRGALAGPVTVGVVVVEVGTRGAPTGVRDSKLLTPAARQALVPRLQRWAPAHAVGHAEPHEIDNHGIIAALRLAGRRALAQLALPPTLVLLDGSHDWLTPPRAVPVDDGQGLLDLDLGPQVDAPLGPVPVLLVEPEVVTKVKADLRCAAVAAASVLAKVARDAIMVERSTRHPRYNWAENKGYSAPDHVAALRRWGPCEQHRQSWSLPGCGDGDGGSSDSPLWVDLDREAASDPALGLEVWPDVQVELDAGVEVVR